MYIFLEGKANLSNARREQLFIEILEQLDPDDSKLLLEAKSRKIKGVSKNIIKQAYDDFLIDPANS
jgi:hypothetical protein